MTMKKIDKKAQKTEYRGEVKELMRNYDLEMKVVRRVPKVYYSREGELLKADK